jgi:hypothetical protein
MQLMSVRSLSTLFLILLGFTACLHAQSPSSSPQTTTEISYDEILKRLQSHNQKSTLEINEELIDAVHKQDIWFVLTEDLKKELISAGANKELIEAIDNALPKATRDEVLEIQRLWKIVVDNYYWVYPERTLKAINAGKEFLSKFSDEPHEKEYVDWLRKTLPKLEKRLHDSQRID